MAKRNLTFRMPSVLIRYKRRKNLPPEVRETEKIGQVSLKSGIPIVTLRFFERSGLITSVKTSRKSTHRRYDPSIYVQLDFIRLCRISGFSIPQTKGIMKTFNGTKPTVKRMRAIQRTIESIRRQKQGLDTMEKILRLRMESPDTEVNEMLAEKPLYLDELLKTRLP